MIRIVLHGLEGPIRVRGVQFPGTAMPPHRDLLDDRRIAAVITFVRQAWGNNALPVDAEIVAKERQAHGSRTQPWTEAELGRPQ